MKKLSLPNLIKNPNAITSCRLGKREYTFRFRWSGSFCALDIYITTGNSNNYLVKGRALAIGSDVIARVKDEELIEGSLILRNKFGNNTQPQQEDFHTDYYLEYRETKLTKKEKV